MLTSCFPWFLKFFLLRIFIISVSFFKAVLLNSCSNEWRCVILAVKKHYSGFISKLCCRSWFLIIEIAKFPPAEAKPRLGVCLPCACSLSAAACLLQGGVGGQLEVKLPRSMVWPRQSWDGCEWIPWKQKTNVYTQIHQLQHWLHAMVSLATKCASPCSMVLLGARCPPMHLVPVQPTCSGQAAATSIQKNSLGDRRNSLWPVVCNRKEAGVTLWKPGVFLWMGY